MRVERICVYSKDIVCITGKSIRSCQRILQQIRNHYQKNKNQSVSIEEFCLYTGLDMEQVRRRLIG